MGIRADYPYNFASLHNSSFIGKYTVLPKNGVYTLGIGLTSQCNFDCPICYYHSSSKTFKNTSLPLTTLQNIFNNSPQFKNVHFAMEGEPFCYSGIFDALDMAMEHSDSIAISTNGSLLSKDNIQKLSQYNFSLFSLSIDADNENSYAVFRKGGTLSSFLRVAEMTANKIGSCVIFNTVLYEQNLNSVTGLPKLASTIGISGISLMQLRQHSYSLSKGIIQAHTDTLLNCLEKLIINAEQYNVTLFFDKYFANKQIMDWLSNIESSHVVLDNFSKGKCSLPWSYASVLSSGKLFPCCGDFLPEKITSYSFDGIYNHEYLQVIRGNLIESNTLPACKICRNE